MRRRVPRLLLAAFALSLLVHLIVALVLRPSAPTPESQTEVVSIQHRPATIAVRKVPTPPPPPPKKTTVPHSAASSRPKSGPGEAGSAASTPAPTPLVASATAAPTPAVTPGCVHSSAEASVVASPPPPDIAPDVRAAAISGIARVSVQLDTGGVVTGATVTQSTGNSSLDLVAVTMARDARYAPALHDCKPIASAYTFSVKFVAW